MNKVFAFAVILLLLPSAYGNGAEELPTISAKLLDHYNNVRITVTDVVQQRDYVYVTIRFPFYDKETESYFLDSGKRIRLIRKDKTNFEVEYHSDHDGVHGTTARLEYVFNHYPDHHNDHTRSVVTDISFYYH